MQATTAVDDIAQSKMKALLVTTLPDKGSDDGGLYCSIPVALPPEDGAANAPLHTMLLVPCSKVPAGVHAYASAQLSHTRNLDVTLFTYSVGVCSIDKRWHVQVQGKGSSRFGYNCSQWTWLPTT